MMRKHYSTFDLAMLKRDGLSFAEISEKTGIDIEEVKDRIRRYHRQGRAYAGESYARNVSTQGKVKGNSRKHPERNSQYAERRGDD